MRKWREKRGQRHMEILILHRCVQGHEGALCFIITPLDYDGTAEAAVPEDFSLHRVQIIDFNLRFVSANVCKMCSWKWCLAFRSVSEVDILHLILEEFRPRCCRKILLPKPWTQADSFSPVDRLQWKLKTTLIFTGWLDLKGLASGKITASGECSA